MSKIRGKNTKPEMILRSALSKKGYRFKIHLTDLLGKPDIVLPKFKTVIFVHGCFWHYHKGCKERRIPSSNSTFWKSKLKSNKLRDRVRAKVLINAGWHVLIIWECEIEKHLKESLSKIEEAFNLKIQDSVSQRTLHAAKIHAPYT